VSTTTSPNATTAAAGTAFGNGNGNGNAGGDRVRRPGRQEWRAYVFSIVAVVVYLILAYFVFVRPGVRREDHVLAVLLPAAILALSAELYTRLPAGLRASLALVFGVVGLVAGLVQVQRLRVEGVSASAVCGLLPLAAGVVLVGMGVWLVWTSRKRSGPLWWTILRRVLIAIVALFVVYWIVLPVSMAIVATERPNPRAEKPDLGRPSEKVTLVTRDGLRLSAWYAPSLNRAAIVTYPGAWTVRQARMLVGQGYGVLLVDPRGYGESEGDPNAYGWGSTRDVDAAVAWLRRRPDVQRRRIGGLGLSVGGEVMIEAAARNPGLKAVVSEGAGIRSVRESLLRRGPNPLEKALQYPQDLMQTVSVWVLSGETVPMSLKNASLLIAPRSVFFIYGGDGQAVEKAVNPVYYDAAFVPKAIWEVPGAGHTRGIETRPLEYESLVVGFFDRTLLGE
jgi:fermentation-respiration switch protein FrsA (DUF1100 family)